MRGRRGRIRRGRRVGGDCFRRGNDREVVYIGRSEGGVDLCMASKQA